MLNLSQLTDWSYYTTFNPGGDFIFGYAALVFFILLIIAPGMIRKIAIKNKYLKKSIKRRFWAFPILGFIGIILVASRFSEVPGFSMRIWLYMVLVLSLLLGIYIAIKVFKDYKKRVQSVEREKERKAIV